VNISWVIQNDEIQLTVHSKHAGYIGFGFGTGMIDAGKNIVCDRSKIQRCMTRKTQRNISGC
jgi:hypothetical protein